MNKPRLFFVLALVFVFAAGVVAGVFAERLWFAKKPAFRGPSRGGVPTHDRWSQELGLTDEQKAKIQEIFKKNEERMKDLRAEYNKFRSEFDKRVGVVREELRKEIDAVLTPEQRKKQEAMIQRAREEHRRDMERRNPPPRPRSKNIPQGNPTKERTDEQKSDPRSGDYRDRRGSHPGLHPD
jgi:Spy/CpxP family protein refolding chaperone